MNELALFAGAGGAEASDGSVMKREFRINPIIINGRPKFEVEVKKPEWPWGHRWAFACFADTQEQAKAAIEHLGGQIVRVTTEQH